MSPTEPKAQIFNERRRAFHRARAKLRVERGKGDGFLLSYCGKIAAEKLQDINRNFERAVIIGLPVFRKACLDYLPKTKLPKEIFEFDDWPEELPADCHLIVSGLVLQSVNAVPDAMRMAGKALLPDGLFLSALLGGESLLSLKRACYAVDQDMRGGMLARVAPMIDLQQAAQLLSLAGLALPVTDKDICSIQYKSLKTLVDDLRDIGETNSLNAMSRNYAGRDYLRLLGESYPDKGPQGRFLCSYEIIWMTGWRPHASQQKPLKPGSAQIHLSDALSRLGKKA